MRNDYPRIRREEAKAFLELDLLTSTYMIQSCEKNVLEGQPE